MQRIILSRPVLQRSGGAVPSRTFPGKDHGQADIPAAAAELKADGGENVYVVTCFSDRTDSLQVVKEA